LLTVAGLSGVLHRGGVGDGVALAAALLLDVLAGRGVADEMELTAGRTACALKNRGMDYGMALAAVEPLGMQRSVDRLSLAVGAQSGASAKGEVAERMALVLVGLSSVLVKVEVVGRVVLAAAGSLDVLAMRGVGCEMALAACSVTMNRRKHSFFCPVRLLGFAALAKWSLDWILQSMVRWSLRQSVL
jgi:hypothetical protein